MECSENCIRKADSRAGYHACSTFAYTPGRDIDTCTAEALAQSRRLSGVEILTIRRTLQLTGKRPQWGGYDLWTGCA